MRNLIGRLRRPISRSQLTKTLALISDGDGSTLSLDFTAMSGLDSRFTFSRASTATFINSSGLVESAANGVARFDHDPATLAPRGLLIEGSATNFCIRSQEINTSNWTIGGNTTLTQNTSDVADPAGGNTATKIVLSANAYCSRAQQIFVAGNTQYTFSFWIRGTSGITSRIYSFAGFAGDLVTQTAYSYSTTGWTRVQTTFTTNASTTGIYVYVASKSTAVGSTDTIYVWGAQLEAGSGASSYIPTGSGTVQRAADSCVMTGTNFSSWFNSTAGTFLATGERAITSDFGRLLSANANNTTSAFDLGASTNGRWLITNTTSQADITAGTVTANTAFKVAGAFANNDAQMAFNGTLGTADTSVSLPNVSQLDIGADRTAVYLNGRIRSIKFWPTRLPDATLQSLTA